MVFLGRKGRENFILKSLSSHSIYTMNDDATSLGACGGSEGQGAWQHRRATEAGCV